MFDSTPLSQATPVAGTISFLALLFAVAALQCAIHEHHSSFRSTPLFDFYRCAAGGAAWTSLVMFSFTLEAGLFRDDHIRISVTSLMVWGGWLGAGLAFCTARLSERRGRHPLQRWWHA